MLDWICRSDGKSYGARTIVVLDCVAASLLAGIGVIYAGQAGMNVIGCSVTGCVAALAGGTFSNGMTGAVSRGGVFWVKDPRYLALSLAASIVTFTLMPKYEEKRATDELNAIRSSVGLEHFGAVSLMTFEKALVEDEELRNRLKSVLLPHLDPEIQLAIRTAPTIEEEARILFDLLDEDGNEVLEVTELLNFARHETVSSPHFYAMESAALASLGVASAQSCIIRGLNPVSAVAVAAASGCFGGIMRDMMCRRDHVTGMQNYVTSTAAGASSLIAMRELVLRGVRLPLLARIIGSVSVTLGTRLYLYVSQVEAERDGLLGPMATFKVRVGWVGVACERSESS